MRIPSMIAAVMILCLGSSVSAQVTETNPGEWNYQVVPYLWMSGINGNVAIKGIEANVNASFGDVAKNLKGGFELHYEAQKDAWGYFVDATYVNLSGDGHTPAGASVSTDFSEWLVEFAGFHRLWTRPRENGSATGLNDAMDLLFGGRFWSLSADLDVEGLLSVSGDQSWVDPFIGVRYASELSEPWLAVTRLDVGGFGIGSSFTWNAAVYFGYRTSEKGLLLVGYRGLGVDRRNGSGSDFFKWNVTYSGPVLGYDFRF